MSCVEVRDLLIRYGDRTAVDRASFSAEAGEVTVILGPNGAGKTSTVEHLEGYRAADGGSSSVLGLVPGKDHRRLSTLVGVMLQHGGIPTAIRPPEVLRQYAGFFDDPLDPADLLDRIGLTGRERIPYRRLSGGEQQRLSLALAIIGRPRCVFLDEPTAGVDLLGRDLIRSVIDELREDGVCVVVTTHDLDEAERLADHVVIMDRGRVVAAGSPAELIGDNAGDELLFSASAGLDIRALTAHLGVMVTEAARGEYRVEGPPTPDVVATLTAWLAEHDVAVGDIRARRQRLDDVFRRLTGPTEDV